MAARKIAAVPADPHPDADKPVGRFYDLAQEVAAKRRGPYQLTADISIPPLTLAQMRAARRITDDTEQLEALLGEQLEAVLELYNDRGWDEWLAFQHDLYEHLFGSGSRDVPGGSQGS